MKLSILFRKWWVILIQGILMIVLSIIIFNNPDAVLAALAFWPGLTIAFPGIFINITTSNIRLNSPPRILNSSGIEKFI